MIIVKIIVFSLIIFWIYKNLSRDGIYWVPKIILTKITKRIGGIFSSFWIVVYLSNLIFPFTLMNHILMVFIGTPIVFFLMKKILKLSTKFIQKKIDDEK